MPRTMFIKNSHTKKETVGNIAQLEVLAAHGAQQVSAMMERPHCFESLDKQSSKTFWGVAARSKEPCRTTLNQQP